MGLYECHYCQSKKLNKTCRNLNFYECSDCGLYARYPMPSESELRLIYSECYSREKIEFDCKTCSSGCGSCAFANQKDVYKLVR